MVHGWSVPSLERVSFVVGLTPGFTMQAPTTIRTILGLKLSNTSLAMGHNRSGLAK